MAHLTAVIDFDGVLAEYDEWKGADVFGDPIPHAAESLQELNNMGWYIVIYTTRRESTSLCKWLYDHQMCYCTLNSCAHNPPGCSEKPIGTVYIDDRGWWDLGRTFKWKRVMRKLRRYYRRFKRKEK